MSLKPVKGKIQSQELNDNFSYLDSTIRNIDKGSPKGVYNTVQELRNDYPNGDNGIYIVEDSWYFWNGLDWRIGGVYQSKALANGSVTLSKTQKAIQEKLRPENVFLPFRFFEFGQPYTKEINKDIYKAIKFLDSRIEIAGDALISKTATGTAFGVDFYMTDEMRSWSSLSFGVTVRNHRIDSVFRITFFDKNRDIIQHVSADYNDGKLMIEGVTIPVETDHFGVYAQNNTEGMIYTNPILTFGDSLGNYSERYANNVFEEIGPEQYIRIGEQYWRQGSLIRGLDYDEAKKSNTNNRITVKKEYALPSNGFGKVYWAVPDKYQVSIVQYDINGKEVANSSFKRPTITERNEFTGNTFKGSQDIHVDANEVFGLLAYYDNSRITPKDIFMEPIYIGFKELPEISGYEYNKIVRDSLDRDIDTGNGNNLNDPENIPCPIKEPSYLYKYIGHGGLEAYAPSMTVEAYKLAALFGTWAIESDAHLTKDNEIVMIHDISVDRTTNGTGNVADLTLKEIKDLKITHGKNLNEYDYDLRVPTIDEYLKICVDNQMYAQIEIKGGVPDKETLIDILLEKLIRYNMVEKTMIIAFNENTLQLVRNKHKQIWVSRIYSGNVTQSDIYRWKELGNFILFNYNPTTDLNVETINLLNQNNIPYLHGVRNDKESHDYIKSLGVPAIATNNFYDTNRPTVKYNAIIETSDGGNSWGYVSINNMVDVKFDTNNNDMRFMFEQVPRNWLKQLNGKVEIVYLGIEDVIGKAFYDDEIKQIRCKFYKDGIIKNVGNIPNGKFNVTILL